MEHEKVQSLTLATSSSVSSTSNTPTSMTCDPRLAGRLATQLFSCFRASDANDPKTYIAAATAILSRYPEAIVRKVCDPVRGLPSEDKWLPSLAEIRVVCEREMQPHYEAQRREKIRQGTIALRSGKAPIGSAEHRRCVEGFAQLSQTLEATNAAAAYLARARETGGSE